MKMCENFSLNNHQVTLLGFSGEGGDVFDFYNVQKRFDITLINKTSSNNRIYNIFKRLSKIRKAMQIARKNHDLVYTRCIISAILFGVIKKRRTVFEYHSVGNTRFRKLCESMLIKYGSQVRHIFVTKAMQCCYLENFPNLKSRDYITIPNGANEINLTVKDIAPGKLSCGYLGSFINGKGIEMVLALAKELPETNFHIIGGEKKIIEKYKLQYSYENIVWHGFLKQKEAFNILAEKIDIALLPNKSQMILSKGNDIGEYTSPIKLLEYMSFAKAIVASDLPVLRELITHEVNALLVDSENISEWIQAIKRLQADNQLLKTIRLNAYTDLIEKYSWRMRSRKCLENIL